ncbi:hypothetical protein HU200_039878 [Digitaria exilis]|uniref:TF-B3 domain-containing protein n=1 Tax=Digitaria exilis TaxID=1010633 RepID=A0A835BFS8_9POAL|nr:hypothetical protein HU200_039878 [Digitaria exilis]
MSEGRSLKKSNYKCQMVKHNVKVARENNALVMGSGWANFASIYDLKLGDFLVFTYNGKSHFKVCIFDPSNCEKYFSCVVMDNTYEQDRIISNDNHMQSPTSKSEQKTKIDSLEKNIKPQVPLYITAMDMTSVSVGYLAISKDYVIKHLLDKNATITVSHLNGSKTWPITLAISTVGRYALSTGWLDFIDDNGLREGDICVFEPSKSEGRVTLIFHPLEICDKKAHHHASTTSKKSCGRIPRQLAASPSSSNDHVKHGAIGEEDSDEEYANSTYYSRIANRLSDEEKGE